MWSFKLYEHLKKFFDVRYTLERSMTKNELSLFDIDLLQNFTPEKLKKAVITDITYNTSLLILIFTLIRCKMSFFKNMPF